jgi:hypothetical protein
MFTTSLHYRATDLSDADSLCAARAQAGHLAGHFVAWLSTSATSALAKIQTASGWVRPDGLPFAASANALLAGQILYPPSVDEMNETIPAGQDLVFTGTTPGGTPAQDTCSDWSSTAPAALYGHPDASTVGWTEATTLACNNEGRLYCFQTDFDTGVTPPTLPRASDRIAFLSSEPFDPSMEIAGADALCGKEYGPTTRSFLALLATPTSSARGRFALDGRPILRPDGVTLTNDLLTFQATPNVTIGGDYIHPEVYSGAYDLVSTSGTDESCAGWTMGTAAAHVRTGFSGYLLPTAFGEAGEDCTPADTHVYCVQE